MSEEGLTAAASWSTADDDRCAELRDRDRPIARTLSLLALIGSSSCPGMPNSVSDPSSARHRPAGKENRCDSLSHERSPFSVTTFPRILCRLRHAAPWAADAMDKQIGARFALFPSAATKSVGVLP